MNCIDRRLRAAEKVAALLGTNDQRRRKIAEYWAAQPCDSVWAKGNPGVFLLIEQQEKLDTAVELLQRLHTSREFALYIDPESSYGKSVTSFLAEVSR